jgi:predicted DNA-binding protein (MmcQ/YjbR family)
MFAAIHLEPGETWLSFKCSAPDFADLVERPGCRSAPYLARASWVALEHPDALESHQVERLLKSAYEIVLSRLPKKLQRELAASPPAASPDTSP